MRVYIPLMNKEVIFCEQESKCESVSESTTQQKREIIRLICAQKKVEAVVGEGLKPCRGAESGSRGEDVVTQQPADRSLC